MSRSRAVRPLSPWRRRAHQVTHWLAFGIIGITALVGGALLSGVRFVWTDSLPRGVYFVHRGTIMRNRIVATCLPAAIGELGLARGYISKGACPGGAGELAKIVAALPGDRIRVSKHGVYINGRRWPWSSVDSKDSSHRPLGAKLSAYRVAPGHALLLGLNTTSWDGRYFGPIDDSLIQGLASPIFIENGAATQVLRAQYPIVGYLHF